MGQNARKIAEEKFGVEKMVEQIEWVYEGLLNEKVIFGVKSQHLTSQDPFPQLAGGIQS